jgi:hypothetical protein
VEKIYKKLQAFNERFAVRLSLTTLHEADWYDYTPTTVLPCDGQLNDTDGWGGGQLVD